jgi:hypothetical protein
LVTKLLIVVHWRDIMPNQCKGELMTRFFVNDREISPPLNAASLEQVLKHVEDVHLPPDSLIRRIQIDGLPFVPNGSPKHQSEMLSEIQKRGKVEIFTGTIAEIARHSIVEALAYLDRIEAATPSLAESFRISPGAESFKDLQQLSEGFYWLNLLLDKLKISYRIDLNEVLIQEVPAQEYCRKFISILKQLIESQEKRDFVLIADLLEYEILPLVPVWKDMFSTILRKVI